MVMISNTHTHTQMHAPVPPSPSNPLIPRDYPHKHTNKFKKTGEEICFTRYTLSMSIHRQSRCKFGLNSHFNDRRLFSNLESHSNNEIKIIRAMYYYCVMFLLLYTSVIMPSMSFCFTTDILCVKKERLEKTGQCEHC